MIKEYDTFEKGDIICLTGTDFKLTIILCVHFIITVENFHFISVLFSIGAVIILLSFQWQEDGNNAQ